MCELHMPSTGRKGKDNPAKRLNGASDPLGSYAAADSITPEVTRAPLPADLDEDIDEDIDADADAGADDDDDFFNEEFKGFGDCGQSDGPDNQHDKQSGSQSSSQHDAENATRRNELFHDAGENQQEDVLKNVAFDLALDGHANSINDMFVFVALGLADSFLKSAEDIFVEAYKMISGSEEPSRLREQYRSIIYADPREMTVSVDDLLDRHVSYGGDWRKWIFTRSSAARALADIPTMIATRRPIRADTYDLDEGIARVSEHYVVEDSEDTGSIFRILDTGKPVMVPDTKFRLHEWCCHHPCKARFRRAGSPLPEGS